MDRKPGLNEPVIFESQRKPIGKIGNILRLVTLLLLSVAAVVFWLQPSIIPFKSATLRVNGQNGPVVWGSCGQGSSPLSECGYITYVSLPNHTSERP